ncbi:MAG: tRNA (adenosine(37)-N6)-threonylcarbamoyltransferase complex dimerization subunit type 1 TsaB [Gemmatimonadales bacterium]|nr:MAG: tRNA (adenosine(37)-N6)-threonylcarbamoyltransferase complex dimerization subunit type 1 TsaB [Gemmatimonadales bacterium]
MMAASDQEASVVLALEAGSEFGSVAVEVDGELAAVLVANERRRQAADLVPMIRTVLARAGVRVQDLSEIVVGKGPGSFTGVRIGIATARGLSMGSGCPVRPLSSILAAGTGTGTHLPNAVLQAMPAGGPTPDKVEAPAPDRPRLVLLDARGNRLWMGCVATRAGRVEVLLEPRAALVEDLAALDLPEEVVACGGGALRHADVLRRLGLDVAPWPEGLPSAPGLLALRRGLPKGPLQPPGSRWSPDYLRPSQPEREALRPEAS